MICGAQIKYNAVELNGAIFEEAVTEGSSNLFERINSIRVRAKVLRAAKAGEWADSLLDQAIRVDPERLKIHFGKKYAPDYFMNPTRRNRKRRGRQRRSVELCPSSTTQPKGLATLDRANAVKSKSPAKRMKLMSLLPTKSPLRVSSRVPRRATKDVPQLTARERRILAADAQRLTSFLSELGDMEKTA